jgi:hypothetical protein
VPLPSLFVEQHTKVSCSATASGCWCIRVGWLLLGQRQGQPSRLSRILVEVSVLLRVAAGAHQHASGACIRWDGCCWVSGRASLGVLVRCVEQREFLRLGCAGAFADFVRGVTRDYLYDVQLLIVMMLHDGAAMLRMQPDRRNKLVFCWYCR